MFPLTPRVMMAEMRFTENGPDHQLNNPQCPACVYDPKKPRKLRRCSTCGKLIHAEAVVSPGSTDYKYFCGCPSA